MHQIYLFLKARGMVREALLTTITITIKKKKSIEVHT